MAEEWNVGGKTYRLAQVLCEIEGRTTIAIATEDGLPVEYETPDYDYTHHYYVPTIKAILIPISTPESPGLRHKFWKATYCELCRRARIFTPLSPEEAGSFLKED